MDRNKTMYENIVEMSPEDMAVFLACIKAKLYDLKEIRVFSVGEPVKKQNLEWLMSKYEGKEL